MGVVSNVHASSEESTLTNAKYSAETMIIDDEASLNNVSVMNRLVRTGSESVYEEKQEEIFAKITTYGTDCDGCYNVNGYGGTASGVKLSFQSVQQSDGTWRDGITYDGYYIVAANGSIPMGSIVEISNHGFSGAGLVEGESFYAMVLDRGAMTLNHFDLFIGSENSDIISINRGYSPTYKIVRYGY